MRRLEHHQADLPALVIPHGYRDDDPPQSMQDGPSLQRYLDDENAAQTAQSSAQALEESQGQPQRLSKKRRCARALPWIFFGLIIVGACFATFSSPYVFIRYLTAALGRLSEGPYGYASSRDYWWYRLLFGDDYTRHCKIDPGNNYKNFNSTEWWNSSKVNPELWSTEERVLRTVPDYVMEYAPLIHLFSDEEYWPGDPAEHLVHTTPYVDDKPLTACASPYNLTNLDELNKWGEGGKKVFLKSNDNAEDRPDWLHGAKNIPRRDDGSIPQMLWKGNATHPQRPQRRGWWSRNNDRHQRPLRQKRHTPGAKSQAPVVLLVVPKEDGIVDAFWFFFYSYNRGNSVANIRFGDHIGDWEHTLVRFKDGAPHQIFFSEHFFGEAYTWPAIEKLAGRPVGYSGVGTHAMYGTPGRHNYILPLGLLADETDRGPLWDPRENVHAYTYDHRADVLRAATRNPFSPTEWFYFMGHWGDARYPMSDSRQYRFVTEYHYVAGPLGPRYKNLRRGHVCQQPEDIHCDVREDRDVAVVPEVSEADVDEDEEMSVADERQFLLHEEP